MEYWLLLVVVQLLLAPFTYKQYQQVRPKPPQPKKRVLQSDKYKSQQAVTPLSKRGLKPSGPTTEPPKTGVQMVGGKAVLIKSPDSPKLPAPAVKPVSLKPESSPPKPNNSAAPPPPPPPSIHSKLNPVKPKPAVPIQRTPTPIPKPGIDVPARVLIKLDRYTYDRDISTRLVMNVSHKNPGKDGTWCAEKALWDIERDRQ